MALLLVFAGLAYAQAPAAKPADNMVDLLELLRGKGILSQQEYDALKQRIVTVAPAATPAPPGVPAPAQKTEEKPGVPFVRMMETGVGLHVGEVDVRFTGELNAFYVHDRSTRNTAAPVLGLASTSSVPNSSVRNGLLPSNFSIIVSTKQMGYDVGVTFGFYPGINSLQQGGGGLNLVGGNPTGFGTSGIDFRQQFVTVGKARMGTFKFGRDIGLFGQEAILNDMTLLGAGTTNGNVAPGSVTLGRIGVGYVYTDFSPQLTYTTPSASGVQAAFGIFTPMSDVVSTTLGLATLDAKLTGHGQPQFQGKLTYTTPGKGPYKAKLWTNFMTQSMEANLGEALPTLASGANVRSKGVDFGGKFTAGPADFVAYGYKGWGLGTEGLLFLATSATGHTRESNGYYLQGTYTVAKKLTFGVSYGLSHLDLASGDATPALSALFKDNSSYVGQVRYSLTKWVNLLSEYTHTRTEAHAGPVTSSDSVAVGSILFF